MPNIVSSEEFKKRFDHLCAINPLAKRISDCKGGYKGFPPHLKIDALKRMGLRQINDLVSDGVTYEDIGENANEHD